MKQLVFKGDNLGVYRVTVSCAKYTSFIGYPEFDIPGYTPLCVSIKAIVEDYFNNKHSFLVSIGCPSFFREKKDKEDAKLGIYDWLSVTNKMDTEAFRTDNMIFFFLDKEFMYQAASKIYTKHFVYKRTLKGQNENVGYMFISKNTVCIEGYHLDAIVYSEPTYKDIRQSSNLSVGDVICNTDGELQLIKAIL